MIAVEQLTYSILSLLGGFSSGQSTPEPLNQQDWEWSFNHLGNRTFVRSCYSTQMLHSVICSPAPSNSDPAMESQWEPTYSVIILVGS
ncbi:hypothetical protein LX32DRAFT_211139 [Colletotrichum zoysiae]|uniref:Uncharacterized protein n=1 Tax=Colletotrichum zoysiae TaxID=1216348 RepID=A0AAD9M421_9PEZI|nr:hypothetical protein LX32DRAFT_211139 [Colletotrichum zoysiae]